MKLLITGSGGKVGRATVAAAVAAGHKVTAVDLHRASFDRPEPGAPRYAQADLTDAGDAFAVLARTRFDAVIHAAAIPEPTGNPPHVVFHNNLMGTFNLLEAAVRFGVPRFVHVSQRDGAGLLLPRAAVPARLPADRRGAPGRAAGPLRAGEVLRRAALRRGRRAQRHQGHQHPAVVGPERRQLRVQPRAAAAPTPTSCPRASGPTSTSRTSPTRCCSPRPPTCRATRSSTSPRPTSPRRGTLPELLARHGLTDKLPLRDLDRPDASSISIAKARRLLGYDPRRSWRDHLDEQGHKIGDR